MKANKWFFSAIEADSGQNEDRNGLSGGSREKRLRTEQCTLHVAPKYVPIRASYSSHMGHQFHKSVLCGVVTSKSEKLDAELSLAVRQGKKGHFWAAGSEKYMKLGGCCTGLFYPFIFGFFFTTVVQRLKFFLDVQLPPSSNVGFPHSFSQLPSLLLQNRESFRSLIATRSPTSSPHK